MLVSNASSRGHGWLLASKGDSNGDAVLWASNAVSNGSHGHGQEFVEVASFLNQCLLNDASPQTPAYCPSLQNSQATKPPSSLRLIGKCQGYEIAIPSWNPKRDPKRALINPPFWNPQGPPSYPPFWSPQGPPRNPPFWSPCPYRQPLFGPGLPAPVPAPWPRSSAFSSRSACRSHEGALATGVPRRK